MQQIHAHTLYDVINQLSNVSWPLQKYSNFNQNQGLAISSIWASDISAT